MSLPDPKPIAQFTVDSLRVLVYEDRAETGRAAAEAVAQAIAGRAGRPPAGPTSSSPPPPARTSSWPAWSASPEIDWSRVVGFHMDEYLGPRPPTTPPRSAATCRSTSSGSPASTDDRLRLIPGEQAERPLRTCLDYEDAAARRADRHRLRRDRRERPPGVQRPARRRLPRPRPGQGRPARRTPAARSSSTTAASTGIEDVPTHAYTLTIPALLTAPVVSPWSSPARARPRPSWPPSAARSARRAPPRPFAATPARPSTSTATPPGW